MAYSWSNEQYLLSLMTSFILLPFHDNHRERFQNGGKIEYRENSLSPAGVEGEELEMEQPGWKSGARAREPLRLFPTGSV